MSQSVNNMRYEVFFKKISGFSPYAFQNELNAKYLKGQNIILQAPTGSGKTWAAITPFIYSWYLWKNDQQEAKQFPRKMIYSLPLRTLANSLYQEVQNKIAKKMPELDIKISLQTGENRDDIFFESDIIFTTIDQTLSNFLCIPLSLPQKLANINAGAILSAYLVFDEFHLLEPMRSLNTSISIVSLVKEICPFCFMTATLSNQFLINISEHLNASIIRIQKKEYKKFSFVKKKSRKIVSVVNGILNIENIIEQHKQKSIVICNTVDRCVKIFKELQKYKEQNKMDMALICIHSRFFKIDRKKKEESIKNQFSDNDNSNVILISTQVIEVGLDISCDIMHTEISPINSFLQRIGRCARWGGTGKIFVYDVPERKYSPYDTKLCIDTFTYLAEIGDQNLDFHMSQVLIKKILEKKEINIFREINNNKAVTWDRIKDCWQRNDKANARELIRNINSISVVLLPENFQTTSLYQYDSLSISPYSLKYKIEKIMDESKDETPFYVFDLDENNFFDDENDYKEKKLQPISPDNIADKNIIVLNSNHIGYSKEYGLDFQGNFSGYQSCRITKHNDRQYFYYKDTYEQHIKWMIEIYEERFKDSIVFSIKRIQKMKYANFDFDKIIKYTIGVHDYGKLDDRWQKIMNTYQNIKEGHDHKNNECLTHTDFNPETDDKDLMNEVLSRLGKKPNHAGVGAFLSYCVLRHVLDLEKNDENHSFLKVILTVILRHHGATTKRMPEYTVSDQAIKFFNDKLLRDIAPDFSIDNTEEFPPFKGYYAKDLGRYIIPFGNFIETFTYFILVRLLRLCDQESFEKNSHYMEDSNG